MRLDPPRGPAGLRAPTARMRLVLQASDRPEVQMHTHASAPVLFSVWKKSVRGPWAIFGVKPPKDGACARVGSTVFGGGADRVVEGGGGGRGLGGAARLSDFLTSIIDRPIFAP